jgi:hypothetical protein
LAGTHRQAFVIGVNGTGIAEIKEGKLLASGDYAGFQQGCLGVMTAIRSSRGLPVQEEILFPPTLITKDNVQAYDVPDDKRVCPKWEDLVKKLRSVLPTRIQRPGRMIVRVAGAYCITPHSTLNQHGELPRYTAAPYNVR